MDEIGDIMIPKGEVQQISEEIIIVKKKRISFEKVKLSDVDIKYKNKDDKYYSKFKVKDKDGKDKERTILSVKFKYKDYDGIDKEISDVRIVTGKTFKDDAEADAFIQEQIKIFERNFRDERATKLRDEIEEVTGEICKSVVTSEEYE